MAEGLDDGGVIGEGFGIRLFVGAEEQGKLKGLGCLHEAVEGAVNGDGLSRSERSGHGGCGEELADGFDDGDDGDGGAMLAGGIEGATDDLGGGEGADAVVDGDQRVFSVFARRAKTLKTALHAVEAGGAAIGDGMREDEMVLRAEILPEGLLVLGQHQDEADAGDGALKSLQRVHQHRSPADGQELLRQVGSHAEALAAGDNYAKGGPTPSPLPREGSSYL